MIKRILLHFTAVFLFLTPLTFFAQSIQLGSAADFVLFSTVGAVTNTGVSQLTGRVGTNSGSTTGFGNVNGQMHDNDSVSAKAAVDLLIACNQLDSAIATAFPASLLGNGQTLTAGIYSISAATTLNLNLNLNAAGDTNAVFIFKIQGPLSTNANSSITLLNGAKACNVYWKVEGLVDMASGTKMRGNVIANNAAINISAKVTLEGRALSTSGAITVNGVLGYTPTGCGSPILSGPIYPNLGSTACYSLFSANGSVTNTGTTHLPGDVGTNVGLTTGFNPLLVGGMIHPIPDGSTAACAADLGVVYTYLNSLPVDIELLYPAQFGRNLVLTPHTYVLNGATTLTDTLYLNAENNSNAVFVIRVNGAFGTSTFANVILTNGAQAKNVFWEINGAVTINNYSTFNGSIICNNAAINLNKGSVIHGRIHTTNGAFSSDSIRITMPTCTAVGMAEIEQESLIQIYPNPFSTEIYIQSSASNKQILKLRIYTVLGKEVLHQIIQYPKTRVETKHLSSGIYFYQVMNKKQVIQSGKLISQ